MAEIIFFLGLIAPFALMVWLVAARRRARQAASDHEVAKTPAFSEEGFTEEVEGEDGLSYGRRYDGDGKVIPPEDQSGEVAGVKAIQGRR